MREELEAFAKNVRVHRERLGMSKSKLGREANVNRRTIEGYENGSVIPMVKNLIRLAEIFEIDPMKLLELKEVVEKIPEHETTEEMAVRLLGEKDIDQNLYI